MKSLRYLCFLACAAPLAAQARAPQLVDKGLISVIVGDSIILKGEVDQELEVRFQLMDAQGMKPPRGDSAATARLRKELIDEMIDRLVIIQVAMRDTTIKIDPATLNAEVDREIADRRQRMGGALQLEEALRQQRLTLGEFRELLTTDVRKETLVRRYMGKQTSARRPPPISEKELRSEFDKRKASFGQRPPTITFQQVVMFPRASDSARAAARKLADSLLTQVRTGADLAELAKRFSADPGSKDKGGDLGWSRPSDWVPEFANAVLFLGPGQVSPIVETAYGFHIIRLEKIQGPQRQVRHILIAPESGEGDVERAMVIGRTVAEQLRKGANFDSIIRSVGSIDEARVGPIALDSLQKNFPPYHQNLAQSKPGDIVGPFVIGDPSGRQQIVVVKVTDIRPAGEYSFDDPIVKEQFKKSAEQQRLVAEIMEELRRQTYIEIRR
jgi:peptidyl-prolyl cis-trans isomerase SurA